jgi:hypothetical protein
MRQTTEIKVDESTGDFRNERSRNYTSLEDITIGLRGV